MVEGQLLIKHEGGQFAASRFQIRQECRPVFLNGSEEQGRFGQWRSYVTAPAIARV